MCKDEAVNYLNNFEQKETKVDGNNEKMTKDKQVSDQYVVNTQSVSIQQSEGKTKKLEEKSEKVDVKCGGSKPISVYIDGSSLSNGTQNARAGFGVYWGENDKKYFIFFFFFFLFSFFFTFCF